uniref:Vasculin n=1 Tax=Esox lucius TaxID=8010 RepID=A0A3P8YQU4_ESOLU
MAQHDFTPAWLNFPTAPSSSKVPGTIACGKPQNICFAGGYSRNEKNGWRVRNGSEGSSSRAPLPQPGPQPFSKSKCLGKVQQGHRDRRKKFEAEDFPSLNPDAEREINHNRSVTTGVWEHPPNPQSRTSRMTVIKRVSREEPPTTPPSPATPQQQHASSHNGAGPSVYKGPVLKPVSLPVKVSRVTSWCRHEWKFYLPCVFQASRSSSLSPVDKGSPPRLMMRLTRMRSDRKSHFLKALKRDAVDEEDLHHHCKDEDGFHLQNSIMGCRDENLNRYECTVSQENSNTNALLRSSTFPQQEVLSSSLEAEHRLLKEMGWQEESENDDTCAPLTEDEMREFQAISEQLRKNGLRRNGLPKNGPPVDSLAVWKTGHLGMTAGAAEETETSSSDTSDDDA